MDEIGAEPKRAHPWLTYLHMLWAIPFVLAVIVGMFLLVPLIIVSIGALFGYDSNPPVP